MTLGQLEEMPNSEYLQWRAFYVYREAMREQAQRQAEAENG